MMKKPTNPPQGYRMLIEGQDVTTAQDLLWVSELKDFRISHRWAHAVKQTENGLVVAADTGQLYKEPKQVEDYCFFRCRKIGLQR
jgi:hypothetical protein